MASMPLPMSGRTGKVVDSKNRRGGEEAGA